MNLHSSVFRCQIFCDQQTKNHANQNQNNPCIDDINDDDEGNDDDDDRETIYDNDNADDDDDNEGSMCSAAHY